MSLVPVRSILLSTFYFLTPQPLPRWIQISLRRARLTVSSLCPYRGAMGKPLEQVAQEVAQLPKHQRLALAGLILALDDDTADPDAETLWEEEIQARIKAIGAGTADGVSHEEVMREAGRRLAS